MPGSLRSGCVAAVIQCLFSLQGDEVGGLEQSVDVEGPSAEDKVQRELRFLGKLKVIVISWIFLVWTFFTSISSKTML